jgi:hypothetical protein
MPLPTEGGRESVIPVSRTLLNHPISYARQNPEFRFLPLRWTAITHNPEAAARRITKPIFANRRAVQLRCST